MYAIASEKSAKMLAHADLTSQWPKTWMEFSSACLCLIKNFVKVILGSMTVMFLGGSTMYGERNAKLEKRLEGG